jgi:hypothetical protein
VAGSREHGNKLSVSVNGEGFLTSLLGKFMKKVSGPCS